MRVVKVKASQIKEGDVIARGNIWGHPLVQVTAVHNEQRSYRFSFKTLTEGSDYKGTLHRYADSIEYRLESE